MPPIGKSAQQSIQDSDQTIDISKTKLGEETSVTMMKNISMESLSSTMTRDISKKKINPPVMPGTSKHIQAQLPKKKPGI